MICDGTPLIYNTKLTEEETIASHILFLEVYAIIHILAKQGNALIKFHLPLIEPMTISILYLLIKSFANVNIVKPNTSYADSSEVYCVCKSYNGIESINRNILNKLDMLYDNYDTNDSISDLGIINMNFIDSLFEASNTLSEVQILAIKKVLYLRDNYYKDYDIQTSITEYKETCCTDWLKEMDMRTLNPEQYLR
jgi:hypothetical protein